MGQFECDRCCVSLTMYESSIVVSNAVICVKRNSQRCQMNVEVTITNFRTLKCVKGGRVFDNIDQLTLTKVLFTILFSLLHCNHRDEKIHNNSVD